MSATIAARLFLIVALSVVLQGEASAAAGFARMSDRQNVNFSQLASDAERADVVLIGEVHDNKAHHDLQAAVIRSLLAKKIPIAIGFETMQAESQKQLDDWTQGRVSEEDFKKVFAANWTYDWNLYRDIFILARDNRIPLIALNLPKEIVKKVSRKGYQSLSEQERKNLPKGTTCDLNNPHTEFLKKSFKELFQNVASGRIFSYFCEAQTLRNSGMASNIKEYTLKHPERKFIALAGIWHAVKNAIPEQLERNGSKLTSLVILPEIAELRRENATAAEADYMVGGAPEGSF
ncbi:MAG TPA: hypothetical protein DCZ75_08885 [Geobacter sp.]|nr:hypothetical protein [Geobacter sp.]